MATKTYEPQRTQRAQRVRPLLCVFVVVVFFVPHFLAGLGGLAQGQGAVTDTDLQRASEGRIVRIGSNATGRYTTSLPLEVYVARVLAGEGEPRAGDAAQQALAVAIRTYVYANAGRHRRDGFDLCDSTHCQVLRTATAITRRAALATAGQVLTYEGRPAEVFYSANCGGSSEEPTQVWPSANYPYMRAVADDVHEGETPWTLDLTYAEIERALRRVGFGGERLTAISVEARSESGRATRLRIEGLEPGVVAGEQFRLAVGPLVLRSTAFEVSDNGARGVRFVGRGFGHGIGMCVVGAGRRATRGENVTQILTQYYPGLSLTPLGTSARPLLAARPAPVTPAGAAAVTPVVPSAVPTGAVPQPPRNAGVLVRSGGVMAPADLQQMAAAAHADLTRRLGVSVAPVTIDVHETLEEFRLATGQPWWVTSVARGTAIDMAPVPVLTQGGGVERALRSAIADLFLASSVEGRPLWVRIGAARYFAETAPPPAPAERPRCPSDAELTLAISAAAQRDAESRAEACFARAYAQSGDWRTVR